MFNRLIAMFYLARGNLRVQSNIAGAVSDANIAVALVPKMSGAHRLRAAGNLALGDDRTALEDLTESIRLKPSNTQAYVNRAVYHYHKGDLAETIADCNRAVRGSVTIRKLAYWQRAIARYQCDDLLGALEDCQRAIGGRTRMAAYCSAARFAAELGDQELADDYLKRASEHLGPRPSLNDQISVLEARSIVLRLREQYQQALGICDDMQHLLAEAAQLSPRLEALAQVSIYELQGRIYRDRGELDTAIGLFTSAMDIDLPFAFTACLWRAQIHASLGAYDKAIEDFSQALQIRPRHLKATQGRSEAYRAINNIDAAIADGREAASILALQLQALQSIHGPADLYGLKSVGP